MATTAQRDRQVEAARKRVEKAQEKLPKAQAAVDELQSTIKVQTERITWLASMPVEDADDDGDVERGTVSTTDAPDDEGDGE